MVSPVSMEEAVQQSAADTAENATPTTAPAKSTPTSCQALGIWVPNSSSATSTASKLGLGRGDVVELY